MTRLPVHHRLTPGPRDFFWRGRNFSYIVACIPGLSVIPTSQHFATYVGSQDMRGSATHRLRLILQRGFCDPRLIPPAMAAPPCPATGTAWTATQGLRPCARPGREPFGAPFRPSHRPAQDCQTRQPWASAQRRKGEPSALPSGHPIEQGEGRQPAAKGLYGHPPAPPARPGSRACIPPHAARQPFVNPVPLLWLLKPEAA